MEFLEDRRLLSTSFADLPGAAQHAVSSAIGQDQAAYHAANGEAGVTLANPANGFTAQVQSGALHVSAGADTWDMSLVGLGYGGTMQPVGPDDLSPLFPMELIMQEISTDRYIDIPEEVQEIYKLYRPTPLVRARRGCR